MKSKHHKCCSPALCLTARLIFSRHLITHVHHVNPMESWHKALLFLSRLKEQVMLHVGRGMNVLYVPQISIGMNIFKMSSQILQISAASFADFLILNMFAHLILMAESPAGLWAIFSPNKKLPSLPQENKIFQASPSTIILLKLRSEQFHDSELFLQRNPTKVHLSCNGLDYFSYRVIPVSARLWLYHLFQQ